MKAIPPLLWLMGLPLASLAGEWYDSLRPGVTRNEILKVAGSPTSCSAKSDIYERRQGSIKCSYTKGILQTAIYYHPGDGAVSWTLYSTVGESTSADLEQRKAYLRSKKFAVLPQFSGRRVHTHKYDGNCYEADGGFLIVEPILSLPGSGYFADKAARVLFAKADTTEEVLYRAAEHWEALRPPGLSDNELRRRKLKLLGEGVHIIGSPIGKSFGTSDSVMGSGIDHRLFYLDNGLVIATCDTDETIGSISILKPGLATLTLSDWLADMQQGTVSHAVPPPGAN